MTEQQAERMLELLEQIARQTAPPTPVIPPGPLKAKINLAQHVAKEAGVSLNAARDRVRRFRAGEISLREMYAEPKMEQSRRCINEVVARVGCCRSTAASRLRRFRVGLITEAQLYAPTTGGRK